MRLRQLFEAPRTAVMAFGRMNPPTIGHQKLVDKIKSLPGDHYVFLSQSQKPKTDPLAFVDKLRYAKFFFPNVTVGHPEVKTIIQAMQKLEQLGYERIIYVAGSDRVDSFTKLLNQYNGQADKSGNIPYSFKLIQVVSAGERDPDADGAEGMSASKMRAAAAEGDLESFKQGVPQQDLADEMFAAVRQGMGIRDKEPEMAEDASSDEEDEFHKKLDKLVHKTFGHSSDEKKKEKKTDEGWFSGDPLEAPKWLTDKNKAMWEQIKPTTKDKRLVLNLKKVQRFIQAGLIDEANQVIAKELMMMQSTTERTLTKPEEKEKERVVKGMKKAKGDFKDRYGKDAEAVMYATATKLAKKNA